MKRNIVIFLIIILLFIAIAAIAYVIYVLQSRVGGGGRGTTTSESDMSEAALPHVRDDIWAFDLTIFGARCFEVMLKTMRSKTRHAFYSYWIVRSRNQIWQYVA
ncbi:hypothetical protein BDY21DRAFT_367494 [Lineolata rhizophorae]|uniref:Uncharacterized protein n=1 Tax=Lineolata rhizophorae TaxID=578093 RepID=A0A6A6NM99_9PEZI|nr:hypothetical protein BDY21DRAFT_367494 [Lineolata rhizophorae]